jgi:signal-transduction protein with cAMP-binding, CBS, and nucleotidyltransferase domain
MSPHDRDGGETLTLKTKFNLPGIKKLLLRRPADTDSLDTSTAPARALFGPTPETAAAGKGSSLVDFLKQVTLFEDLGRRDLRRLARIVHERDYHDGEYIFQEGKPGAALFVLRRGLVEVVREGSSGTEVPLAMLEPPASFEESAAMGTEAVRWFSARARGPVSLLTLGKSDLDALSVNFPLLANKVLMRLAGIMAIRFRMLLDAQYLKESEEHQETDQ